MYKICICDDDIEHINKIKVINENFFGDLDLSYSIDEFNDPELLLKSLEFENDVLYQVIFLDMEMSEISGIDVAEKIRNYNSNCIIIFVTSYDKYALDSFKVSPFRYILKPINYLDMKKTLTDVIDEIESKQKFFFFKAGATAYQIQHSDIISITSEFGRCLNIRTSSEDECITVYGKIKELEAKINNIKFIKVNQGTIVNFEYVSVISNTQIIMSDGSQYTISRGCRPEVKNKYNLFLSKVTGI